MTYLVDSILFQDLAALNSETVCRNALCEYDHEHRCFYLSVWGDRYAIYPYEKRIDRLGAHDKDAHEYINVFLLHYLLQAKQIEATNDWISEKDIPGGATFFRGPHKIPTHLISQQYGNNLKAFGERCQSLQGVPLELADMAYRFQITPRIRIAVLYWEGDETFLPEAKLLYDRSISKQFAPDVIFALACEICHKIGRMPSTPLSSENGLIS
ncbi:MAG: DUF3786 domain-containing protein [Desulfobacterales bacterium]|jgi:hypothetical protein|nr:DUF3786 domain-containing protein [Desulfobacterales bacterium]